MSETEPTTRGKKRGRTTKPRAEAAAPSANGSAPNKRKKRDELAKDLVLELVELRATMDALTEHYRLRIGGEIAELVQRVEGRQIDGRIKRPAVKVTNAMRERLQAERIKPKKARAKDFARIQKLVEDLSQLLPAED